MQGWRKTQWFLSLTKAEALQTLPVETSVALLHWRPKPCLSQFPTQINGNQRDWENLYSAAVLQGQKGAPHCTSSRTPIPIVAVTHSLHWHGEHLKRLIPKGFSTPQCRVSPRHPACCRPRPSPLQTHHLHGTLAGSPHQLGRNRQRKNRAKREENQQKCPFFIKPAQTGYYYPILR